jgi:beta-mannosidase
MTNRIIYLMRLLGVICAFAAMPPAAFAKEEAGDSLSLSGSDWKLHDDKPGGGEAQEMFNADPSRDGWIPAQVPGNIQADVEAAHRLPPLWYGALNPDLYEVARKDWWYRKDFTVPASKAGKRMTLVFDGVDERCQVWLNGNKLGRNAGMFRRFSFDVSEILKAGETNRLAVQIARMPEELVPYLINSDGPDIPGQKYWFLNGMDKTRQILRDLKTPGNWSFDWSTNVWALGLWKHVWIDFTGPARIEWTRVESTLSNDCTKATVHASLEIDSLADMTAKAEFSISGHGPAISKQVVATLKKGRNVVATEIPVDQPALWWPNGHGEPSLYTFHAKLESADSRVMDAHSTRFGIRELRWIHTAGAPANFISRYQLLVNGRPVRTMGSGLILPYILPGRGLQHELQLLRYAKAAHFTAIRINGGGGAPGADEWYDVADELGILISYEFPIGNAWLNRCDAELRNPELLGNLDVTLRNLIKQTRNHPSIMEYVGGNEMSWTSDTRHPALQLMQKVAAEENDRIFRATCPDAGARHSPWFFDIRGSYRHYNQVETMRYGEFGTCSPAVEEVWYRDIPPKSQWPISPSHVDPILCHKNAVDAVFAKTYWLNKVDIDWAFGSPDNLPDLIRAGQYLGAEGLRYAFDANRRKGRRMGGMTNHCYSEPWPNAAGSGMVDFDGRTYMNYDFVKQALAPISLSLEFDAVLYTPKDGIKATLFMVSDAPSPATGLHWKWLARDQIGHIFDRGGGVADIRPIEVKSLAALELHPAGDAANGLVFVEMRLEDAGGRLLTERSQIFAPAVGRFAGLLKRETALAHRSVERPDGPENLAYVGNGAKPATASSSRPEPKHQPRGLNDGKYGNENSWIGTEPHSWFQVDLGKAAEIGRFKLGRDRTGQIADRAIDYLRIETSLDGRQWTTAFEQAGLTALKGFGPNNTIVVQVAPRRAQFVKVTVDAAKSAPVSELACVDEFEVYAPPKDRTHHAERDEDVLLPRVAFEHSGWTDPLHAVGRASLQVSALPPRIEGDDEVYVLKVKNTGRMTALFCEPHPLLVYRTDLLIDNNNCFIPPGESRDITIRAPRQAAGGLGLAQTGWLISSWNADDASVASSDDVVLSVGRRDNLCREFRGCFDAKAPERAEIICSGNRPDPAQVPFLLSGVRTVRFEFDASKTQAGQPVRLRVHTADQAADALTVVNADLSGHSAERTLPKGLGIQKTDPAHLAFPATIQYDLPAATLREGKNTLTVRVKGPGWLTWDALDLIND